MSEGPEQRYADDARRYQLTGRIATGGMGEVWRGTDTVLGRDVAVKLLKHEYADDATFRSRFSDEARHAAALHHPGIAQIFDFGEATASDGSAMPRPYLVMELVDGQPLSNLIRPGAPMDPDVVRDLLAQAAAGLGAAHRAGIVHRDVKPANLMVTPDRQVKITDFGIARAADAVAITQTGQVLGTPQYLSPEQAEGDQASSASDVYALGVVGFECLSGRRPFQGATPVATALAHLRDPIPELPGSVPASLAAVVHRCLAKDPAERFGNGAELDAALRGTGAAGAPPPEDDDGSTRVFTGMVPPAAAGAGAAAGAAVPPPSRLAPEPDDDWDRDWEGSSTYAGRPGGYDDPPRERRGGMGAVGWLLLAAVLVVALLVGFLLLNNDGGNDDPSGSESSATPSQQPTEEPTSEQTSEAPETVDLDEGDYLGRPVDDVEAELEGEDLNVTLNEVENPGDAEQDTVEGVTPTGTVEKGSTVTVTYYGAPPETEEPSPTEEPSETPSETPSEESPEPEPTMPTAPEISPGAGEESNG